MNFSRWMQALQRAMRLVWAQLVKDLRLAWQWLRELPANLLEGLANRVFAITKPAGLVRVRVRDSLLFLLIGWIWAQHWDVVRHTGFMQVWMATKGSWAVKLLAEVIFVVPYYALKLVILLFLPQSLLLWLPIATAYGLAKYVATRYVEDIYEISDAVKSTEEGLRIAEEFLMRAAFAAGYGRVRERKTLGCRLLWKLRPMICPTEEECLNWGRGRRYGTQVSFGRKIWDFIRGAPVGCPHALAIVNGEVKDRHSPLLLVGGPGYVFISNDSAAVFEKPDGSPEVLGPTTRRMHLIEGFERVRRIVSLREHHVTLSVNTRSRDGLPIEVRDVQLLFGVYRGGRPETEKAPYPFVPSALEQLVYEERAAPVVDRWEQLSSSRLLTNTMRNMASSKLSSFIRSQTVVEFLASVSAGDIAKLDETYQQVARELMVREHGAPSPSPRWPSPPDFVWRSQIGARFEEMANGQHGERARQSGVGLQWIGLGAWHTPVTKVINQHMEAWRISVSNMMRSSPAALAKLRRERYISAFAERVRELIAVFHYWQGAARQQEIAVLRQIVQWLELGALAKFGGIAHAPASWRHTVRYLRSLLPRDPDRTT